MQIALALSPGLPGRAPGDVAAGATVVLSGATGTVTIDQQTGDATVEILSPAEYAAHDDGHANGAGWFSVTAAELAAGPVLLGFVQTPLSDGSPQFDEDLTALTGVWLFDRAYGDLSLQVQWQADMQGDLVFSDMSGATGTAYRLTAKEPPGDNIRVAVTAVQPNGGTTLSRVGHSGHLTVVPAPGAGGDTDYTATIAAGTVAADLTGFPVLVELAGMPPAFWGKVGADGGNLRAFDAAGSTEYPLDVAYIRSGAQDGAVWVRPPAVSAGTETRFLLRVLEDAATSRRTRSDPLGMAGVWSGYEAVFAGGDYPQNRAKSAGFGTIGHPDVLRIAGTVTGFAEDPHQGIAWDPGTGAIYAVDTKELYRYDASGVLQLSNLTPNADVETARGLSAGALPHCCAPTVVGNYLCVPINNYPAETVACLALFDKTTLDYVAALDISAVCPAISGVTYNAAEDRLVACEWGGFTHLHKFTIAGAAMAFDVSVPLAATGPTMTAVQDILWWQGSYWVADDTSDEVVRLDPDGTIFNRTGIAHGTATGANVNGNFEGLCAYQDGIAVLIDPSAGNGFMQAYEFGSGGATGFAGGSALDLSGLASATTFTMSISAATDNDTIQQGILSYRDLSAGGTNDRASLVMDLNGAAVELAAWDNVNSWMRPSPPAIVTAGMRYGVAAVYDGTTRALFVDGVQRVSQSGITPRDAEFDCLTLGAEDDTLAEALSGSVGFAYLRFEALPAEWLLAEHAMLNANASFVSVTA